MQKVCEKDPENSKFLNFYIKARASLENKEDSNFTSKR